METTYNLWEGAAVLHFWRKVLTVCFVLFLFLFWFLFWFSFGVGGKYSVSIILLFYTI